MSNSDWTDSGFGMPEKPRDEADRIRLEYVVNVDIDEARALITKQLSMDATLLTVRMATEVDFAKKGDEDALRKINEARATLMLSSLALAGIEKDLPSDDENEATGNVIEEIPSNPFRPAWLGIHHTALKKAAREIPVDMSLIEPVINSIEADPIDADVRLNAGVYPPDDYDSVAFAMGVIHNRISLQSRYRTLPLIEL